MKLTPLIEQLMKIRADHILSDPNRLADDPEVLITDGNDDSDFAVGYDKYANEVLLDMTAVIDIGPNKETSS